MISMDLKRLLDHEVELFGLDLPLIWKVIKAFAAHCDRFSTERGDIQITSGDKRKVSRLDDSILFAIARMYPDQSVEMALSSLLRLPRILKHALRRTWLAWQSLHGEVSLDDLLIYSTIHTVNSEAVAFIRDNWSSLAQEKNATVGNRKEDDLRAMWDAHMSRASDSDKKWLWNLVGSLFPTIGNSLGSKTEQGADKERYWSRITNGIIEADAVPDQRVFKDVRDWKTSGNASTIVSHLMDDLRYTSVFEGLFEYQKPSTVNLSGDDVLTLAGTLFEKMRSTWGVRANSESCPGFIALWRLQNRGRSFTDYEGWLWAEMGKTLPISLHLQRDLEYYWASDKYSPLDAEARGRLRDRVVKWAHANADAKFLCSTLTAQVPYLLRYLVFGISRETEVSEPEPDWKKRWTWIADALLEAIQHDPLLMIPQAVMLFSESESGIRYRQPDKDDEQDAGPRWETIIRLKRDRIKALFPDTESRRRFADFVLQSSPDERMGDSETRDIVSQFHKELSAWWREGLA